MIVSIALQMPRIGAKRHGSEKLFGLSSVFLAGLFWRGQF